MGDTYKAAVLTEQGNPASITVQSLPKPTPGPNEVLVRLHLTSLCGTDCGQAAGHLGPTRPVLGHEGVGRIEALGSNVGSHVNTTTITSKIEVGQRVGVAWNRDACGHCDFCTNLAHDGETRCAVQPHSGQYVDGTFAQYTLVPARFLLRIPDDPFGAIPDELVAPILCGGVTAYKALKSCPDLYPGQWVAVSGGGGGVGAFVVAFGKAMGYRMIAIDAGAEKGTYALAEGAEHFVDISSSSGSGGGGGGGSGSASDNSVGTQVRQLTKTTDGVAAAIVCAGAGPAYQAALDTLAPFGTLMCVGIPPPHGTFTVHPLQFIARGIKVLGSAVGTRRDTLEALQFVQRGLVTPKVQWAALGSMPTLMDDVIKGKVQGKYVINLNEA